MRLGTCLLIPAALAAQTPLPWDGVPELPWEAAVPSLPPEPLPDGKPLSADPAQPVVSLTGDGTLRISEAREGISFRLGLPGRPLRMLRDAGIPMALEDFPCRFPATTPLLRGVGSLPITEGDFRKVLRGLLWILDDGERRITLVHPATRRVVYLPLPTGQDWEILFYPERLVVQEKGPVSDERRERACWSVPWLVLLPQFMKLALPPPPAKAGTALQPFP